jgi:molybdopterin synthase sulfur carrier subunit
MATVFIPPVLRPSVGNAKQISAQGATLTEVLEDLFSRFPGAREQVLAPEGGLNTFINVYVNNEDVRFLKGLDTPVGPNDTVRLLPAMAGGQR